MAGSTSANETQVGGGHYRKQVIQHWDYVAANGLDYFQGQVTKYVSRWKDKNGIEDLRKAQHFLAKYIELVEHGVIQDPSRIRKALAAKAPVQPIDICTCGHPLDLHGGVAGGCYYDDNVHDPCTCSQFRKK